MEHHYILTQYITLAMESAEYDKLEDGTFSGKVNNCKGVVLQKLYGNVKMNYDRL